MTDEELIARLHKIACHIAADRIEALVKERDEATNQLDSARHSVDVLEKRVEAATFGIGIMQDTKRIAPQDFFAVRDMDGKP